MFISSTYCPYSLCKSLPPPQFSTISQKLHILYYKKIYDLVGLQVWGAVFRRYREVFRNGTEYIWSVFWMNATCYSGVVVFYHWPGTATEDTASGWHSVSTFTCWKDLLGGDWRCLKPEEWVRACTHTHAHTSIYSMCASAVTQKHAQPKLLSAAVSLYCKRWNINGREMLRAVEQKLRSAGSYISSLSSCPAPSLNHNDLTQLQAFRNSRASNWLKNAN